MGKQKCFYYILLAATLSACVASIDKNLDTQSETASTNATALLQENNSATNFVIPSMRLEPIQKKVDLLIINTNSSNELSLSYAGQLFPELLGATFSAQRLSGVINISKTLNGLAITKQLADTPLQILNFAVDSNKEIYLVTTQGFIYKFGRPST